MAKRAFLDLMSTSKFLDSLVNVDEAIEDQLVVGSSFGGIDPVARDGLAKGLESLVGMVEGLDDNGFQLAGFKAGGEEGVDPALISGKASAGGF